MKTNTPHPTMSTTVFEKSGDDKKYSIFRFLPHNVLVFYVNNGDIIGVEI